MKVSPGIPQGLEASLFEKRLKLSALRINSKDCARVLKCSKLAPAVFRHRGVKNVVEDPSGDAGKRLILLGEGFRPDGSEELLSTDVWKLVQAEVDSGRAEFAEQEVLLGYEHLSSEEALAKVLPPGSEVPSSFETIGQIAHFNLREVLLPYKELIGRIVLDKNKGLRTVINKVGSLNNEFRTFEMEVLAGAANFHTTVREEGMSFELDYSEVYWNSRLGQERQRVLKQLESGQIVVDMFAGIGAMSCFAATAGCRVLSNDLNPQGSHWMRINAAKNNLGDQMQVFNMDAREFVRDLAAKEALFSPSRTKMAHVIMNLPELALDFMDVFRGIIPAESHGEGPPGPTMVHCYCFARQDPPHGEVLPRVEAALGKVPPGLQIVNVRDVAPHKIMYCVEFELPEDVLKDVSSKRRKVDP